MKYYVVERYPDPESGEMRNKIVDEYSDEEIADLVAWTLEESNTNQEIYYTVVTC